MAKTCHTGCWLKITYLPGHFWKSKNENHLNLALHIR